MFEKTHSSLIRPPTVGYHTLPVSGEPFASLKRLFPEAYTHDMNGFWNRKCTGQRAVDAVMGPCTIQHEAVVFRALSLRPLPLNLRVFDEIFYPPASPSFDPRSTCFFRQASSFEFPSTFSKWQTGGYILGYFELRLGAGQRLVFGIKQLSVGSSIGKINDKGSYNDCYEPFAEANARMSPRETFFAWKRRVSIAECIGRISGELICPYPPRIPVTIPREIIIERGLNYLVKAKMNGAAINGAFDSELSSIVVCCEIQKRVLISLPVAYQMPSPVYLRLWG
ncbi:hypothetical protein CDL15_Pgr000975 [Punica granatum]|uniref:Orn/Lys/Arg decarboxylase C-terminal domain-containing protein n=1 Tax=Punica granatum TaxID=22663 RepID=A0A218XH42_PUNGR|nr:hypothetical protein CDL15_Pgr000975 [Punica granatum]